MAEKDIVFRRKRITCVKWVLRHWAPNRLDQLKMNQAIWSAEKLKQS